MKGGHAYIDESTQSDYLVICSVVAATNVTEVRKSMRALLLPNQRSIHMKNEKKPQRQAVIIETVCSLNTAITIYCAKPSEHQGHGGARDVCLQQASADAVAVGVQRMILDRNDAYAQQDKHSIIAGSSSTGASRVPFSYGHQSRHEEPLLWIPDVVGWCYARGGQWRAKVSPTISIKAL